MNRERPRRLTSAWVLATAIGLAAVPASQAQIRYSGVEDLLTKHSTVQASAREYWGLTQEEWARYQSLMADSPFATWDHTASPLQVLAFYSTSETERRHYAKLEAELDTWRQHSANEFQRLYNDERERLHARYLEWVETKRPMIHRLRPRDQLRLFVEAGDCDAKCRAVVSAAVGSGARLDIYVRGANNDEAIFQWARSAEIPTERVRLREITLNHEKGKLAFGLLNADVGSKALPRLFRIDAGALTEVAL